MRNGLLLRSADGRTALRANSFAAGRHGRIAGRRDLVRTALRAAAAHHGDGLQARLDGRLSTDRSPTASQPRHSLHRQRRRRHLSRSRQMDRTRGPPDACGSEADHACANDRYLTAGRGASPARRGVRAPQPAQRATRSCAAIGFAAIRRARRQRRRRGQLLSRRGGSVGSRVARSPGTIGSNGRRSEAHGRHRLERRADPVAFGLGLHSASRSQRRFGGVEQRRFWRCAISGSRQRHVAVCSHGADLQKCVRRATNQPPVRSRRDLVAALGPTAL